jgi:hypothetical protein
MSDPTPLPLPGFGPEDLDGHTLEELADYLERDRRPVDPSIEESPACLIALDALQRLRDTAGSFLDDDQADAASDDWIGAVLEAIPLDARSGRSFPIRTPYPDLDAAVTEGALRGLVRAIGDAVPGLLVGGVRLSPGGTPSLDVDVALVHGHALPDAVDRLRRDLFGELPLHVPFPVDVVDVHVVGLIVPKEGRG